VAGYTPTHQPQRTRPRPFSYLGGANQPRQPSLTDFVTSIGSDQQRLPQIFEGVAVGGPWTVAVGLAQESDTAFAIKASKSRAVGLAAESDTAFVVKASKSKLLGLAAESDTAFVIKASKARLIGLASESDTAFVIKAAKSRLIGLAPESDTAFVVVPSKSSPVHIIAVGLALEVDTAFPITRLPVVVTATPQNYTRWVEIKDTRVPHRPRGLQNQHGW